MSLFSAAVAQAAALPLAGLLPPPVVVHRSVVIVAAGGRDLSWPQARIASALLQRSGGRPVHLLLHGGARGADRAIGRAAHQLGWRVQSLPAEWGRYGRSAGPIRNRRLLEQALAEAQARTSQAFTAFGACDRLSRWPRHGLAGAAGPPLLLPLTGAGGGDRSAVAVFAGASRSLSGLSRPRSFRSHPLLVPMSVLTAPSAPAIHKSAGPACTLQRVAPQGAPGRPASLWQLGKADATCWVIEHLRGQAAYRQQQAKRLTELSRSDASRADALEDSLVLVLTRLQPTATRFSSPNHELSSRKSQAVEIEDEDSLPSEWLTLKTTSQPDKIAIKEALKAGLLIPGAQLVSCRSWRIH